MNICQRILHRISVIRFDKRQHIKASQFTINNMKAYPEMEAHPDMEAYPDMKACVRIKGSCEGYLVKFRGIKRLC